MGGGAFEEEVVDGAVEDGVGEALEEGLCGCGGAEGERKGRR